MKYLLLNQESERLTYRPVEQQDYAAWFPLFEDKQAALYLGFDITLSQEEMCEKWFEKVFWRYEFDKGGMNALIDKQTNKLIGQCGLLIQEIDGKEYMEVGYAILPEYRGKGYAAEAALKCKEVAFEKNYRTELISCIHVDNVGSQKVAEKNGMIVFKSMDEYLGMPVDIYKVKKNKL